MANSPSPRKVAVFTGNRAEYGLLLPILRAIKARPDLDLQLLVSGSHLQEDFGSTAGEIEKDGFSKYAEVKLSRPDDSLFGTTTAIGTGVLSVAERIRECNPDLFVVYADRFEGLAAVVAATQMGIPTAHIEGGDITEGGALDDSVRHAMTKLAHLHFTTNDDASERIRKLGEEPWRVHTVGFPAIDLINEGNYATLDEISKKFSVPLGEPLVVFTQHSVSTESEEAVAQIKPSIRALRRLAKEGVHVLMSYPNNDAGGSRMITELKAFAAEGLPRVTLTPSFGRYFYFGLLQWAGRGARGACVGNSSSGIKETLAFGCPAVNIGTRQKNRLRGANLIDADYDEEEIYQAIRKAVFDESFRKVSLESPNPYGKGNAGKTVAALLASVPLKRELLQKKMTY